jgi:hypothetical protein
MKIQAYYGAGIGWRSLLATGSTALIRRFAPRTTSADRRPSRPARPASIPTCEECEGKRFQASVLAYHLGGRDISDVGGKAGAAAAGAGCERDRPLHERPDVRFASPPCPWTGTTSGSAAPTPPVRVRRQPRCKRAQFFASTCRPKLSRMACQPRRWSSGGFSVSASKVSFTRTPAACSTNSTLYLATVAHSEFPNENPRR